ncbi:MAG TPA: hypothetical protein VM925_19775 [Labilithrix sp.]|nr:hypothetical protein [Labilithrix sp.]
MIRREAVSTTADAASVPVAPASPPSSRHPVAPVVEQPLSTDALPVQNANASLPAESVERIWLPSESAPPAPPSYERLEDSDVFVCEQDPEKAAASARAAREVTLFVHGWHNVEPGLLSWTFPSLRAALDAVQRMKNAIGWCVVSGTGWSDLEAARAGGAVLVEQLA